MKRRQLLAVVGAVSVAGCVGDVQSAVLGDEIDASPSELQLEVDQLGQGWELMSVEGEDGNESNESAEAPDEAGELEDESDAPAGESSIRTFYNHQTEELLMALVAVYEETDACEDGFEETRDNADQYSTEPIDIGEDGFGYVTGAATVVFRDANVLGLVAIEPPQFGSVDVDDATEIGETMHNEW